MRADIIFPSPSIPRSCGVCIIIRAIRLLASSISHDISRFSLCVKQTVHTYSREAVDYACTYGYPKPSTVQASSMERSSPTPLPFIPPVSLDFWEDYFARDPFSIFRLDDFSVHFIQNFALPASCHVFCDWGTVAVAAAEAVSHGGSIIPSTRATEGAPGKTE